MPLGFIRVKYHDRARSNYMRLIVARGRQSMATRTTVSSRGHGTASFIGGSHDLLPAIRPWHIRMSDRQRGILAACCGNMPRVILETIQMIYLFIWTWPAMRDARTHTQGEGS